MRVTLGAASLRLVRAKSISRVGLQWHRYPGPVRRPTNWIVVVWIAAMVVTVSAAPASAAAEGSGGTEIPARTEAVQILIPPTNESRTTGHTFTFGRSTDYCGPRGTLREVVLRERPRTKALPFKSAVIKVIVEFPAYQQPSVCPPLPFMWETLHVKTKRPARSLIFYDGSFDPPRRIWPPVGKRHLPVLGSRVT